MSGGIFINLDIKTLAFILSLAFVSQVIALSVQYRVNRTYRGIGWWFLGSSLMALGAILMPMVTVKSLEMFARIANPLVVLGQIFLYLSIMQFLEKKENRWILSSIFVVFTLLYYFYMFVYYDVSSRTIVLTTTLATISLMTAYKLLFKKDSRNSVSANFTAAVFLAYGCFMIMRVYWALVFPPMNTYLDQASILIASFVVPIITSTLWTFGFIIMHNQRLNAEIREEKEKLQLVLSERKYVEEALMESEEKYRSVLNASPDDITITDLEGHIQMISPAAKKMFGYEPDFDSFIGMRLLDFIVSEDVERAQANIRLMYQGGSPRPNEYRGVRQDQSIFDIEVNSGFVRNVNGQPTKMVFIVRDITERKLAEQKIQELVQQLEIERNTAQLNSITDSLTGLANRRYFDEALKTEFFRLKRSGSTLSLILLDVDHFKKFNDSYGHLAGDDCLRQIGKTLKSIVGRAPDIVARYGGEEFVVILPETEELGANALAKRIRKAVEALAIAHFASDTAEYVTVSLGVVTVYPTRLASPEQVVALADEALYCAKNEGRNRVVVATQS